MYLSVIRFLLKFKNNNVTNFQKIRKHIFIVGNSNFRITNSNWEL